MNVLRRRLVERHCGANLDIAMGNDNFNRLIRRKCVHGTSWKKTPWVGRPRQDLKEYRNTVRRKSMMGKSKQERYSRRGLERYAVDHKLVRVSSNLHSQINVGRTRFWNTRLEIG